MSDQLSWRGGDDFWELELPALVENMPLAAYHAAPAVGSTSLRAVMRSNAHYYASRSDELVENDAVTLGTIAHYYLARDTKAIEERYFVIDDDVRRDRRSKVYQALLEEAGDRQVVKRSMMENAKSLAERVRAHPRWSALVGDRTRTEVSLFWKDERTGIVLKARPDLVGRNKHGTSIIDLKTTRDGSPMAFARRLWYEHLAIAPALYCRGWQEVVGEPAGWTAAVVESGNTTPASLYCVCLPGSKLPWHQVGEGLLDEALDKALLADRQKSISGYDGGQVIEPPMINPATYYLETHTPEEPF